MHVRCSVLPCAKNYFAKLEVSELLIFSFKPRIISQKRLLNLSFTGSHIYLLLKTAKVLFYIDGLIKYQSSKIFFRLYGSEHCHNCLPTPFFICNMQWYLDNSTEKSVSFQKVS